MDLLNQHIKQGEVYRRSDLEYYSTAIDRHLAQLTKDGKLVKLNQGLYYAPKQSKFGVVPPDDHQMVERFLKDEDFLIISPNSYNSLGLGLTQLYNTIWVYNHKRKGDLQLNGRTFEFKLKSSFPTSITREYLLVDLLNNLDNMADDTEKVIQILRDKIQEFDLNALMKSSQQYGSGKTKKCLKSLLRKVLVTD
ncbi:MAG: hypothetical protein IM577_12675 [Chitinophagaceae bacterium]|nr:hypothetical protein [Chitinophagaceae bacterium]